MTKRGYCDNELFTSQGINLSPATILPVVYTNKKKRLMEDEIVEIAKLEKEFHRMLGEMNTIATKIQFCFQEIKNRAKILEDLNTEKHIYDLDYGAYKIPSNYGHEQKWMPYIT